MTDMLNDAVLLSQANRAVRAALGEGQVVQSIQAWGGGAHNRGYQLHLADGERLFWKVEKENIFPRPRQGQVEREVTGLRLASEAGVDCACILGYDTSGAVAGCRYILEEFIDAELLGEAVQGLGEAELAVVMAAFQARANRLAAIPGGWFGEVAQGGPLGQHATWPGMMREFSHIMLEDAQTLGCFAPEELELVRRAHTHALGQLGYSGTPAFVHMDMHIFNAFARRNGAAVEVGKLFDFGFCLFLPPYVACYNERAFSGEEARIAREYGVQESELHAFHLLFALEFCNFLSSFRWAPEKPYGYLARLKEYLNLCRDYLM